MENPRMLLLPLLLLPLLLLLPASLPASSAISTPCISIFQILSPCSSALTSSSSSGGDADQPSPSPSCCLPLQSVLSNGTQFGCLCSMLGNSQYQAMLQAALRLPELCHLPIVATEDNCTTLASTGSPSDEHQGVAVASSSSALEPISIVLVLILSLWACANSFLAMAPSLSS